MAASFCTDDVNASASVESMAEHKRFRPYAGATLDTPLFHFLISPVLPILLPLARAIYAIRWQLSRPLQIRVLPSFCPLVDIPLVKDTAVPILLEGPYGSLSMDIDDDSRYMMVLLVSGGIGVTHCYSVAKSIIQDRLNGRKLKHLRFVWAVRNLDMIPAMTPLVKLPTPDLETDTCNTQASLDDDAIGTLTRVVETDIFVTKSSSASPIRLNDGRNLFFGRPDIDVIVADVKEQALKAGVTHVAVLGCGPHMLVDRLKDVCRKHCQKVGEFRGVTFDVHEEIFDF